MKSAQRHCLIRGPWGMAALVLALMTAGGPAWGGTPPSSVVTLERAAALMEAGAFEQATTILRQLVSIEPANRRAKEMLAFALESIGDLDEERQVRSALASQFPNDPRIQADYGRVLERSGEEGEALRAYRRARELSVDRPALELNAAIERMSGRTALEIGMPLAVMSDPDATASRAQAGAAIPVGSRHHLALLGTRYAADGRGGPDATESALLALSFVSRQGAGASWSMGPRLHVISPRGSGRQDVGFGGAIAGRAPLGSSFEAEAAAGVETPWDEAAVTVLRGGRSTAAEVRLYSHWFSRRVLLQAGARRRRISVLAADPQPTRRPEARQSLWLAGADVVLWRKPDAAVRGEMLDETLTARTTLSSAVTLAYRHYDVSTRATPEFASLIALAPRGAFDEISAAAAMAMPGGHLGLELRGGLGRDSARQARAWRAGGALTWAPKRTTRFALGYEEATEFTSGLVGRRHVGSVSAHVDL